MPWKWLEKPNCEAFNLVMFANATPVRESPRLTTLIRRIWLRIHSAPLKCKAPHNSKFSIFSLFLFLLPLLLLVLVLLLLLLFLLLLLLLVLLLLGGYLWGIVYCGPLRVF